jgi:hypothetical protein
MDARAAQHVPNIALPRAPKPVPQEVMAAIPSTEVVRDMMLAACAGGEQEWHSHWQRFIWPR